MDLHEWVQSQRVALENALAAAEETLARVVIVDGRARWARGGKFVSSEQLRSLGRDRNVLRERLAGADGHTRNADRIARQALARVKAGA